MKKPIPPGKEGKDSQSAPNQPPNPEEPEKPSGNYENGVFIQKAPGMSFEEFKEYCIRLFREKGLIKDKEEDEQPGNQNKPAKK